MFVIYFFFENFYGIGIKKFKFYIKNMRGGGIEWEIVKMFNIMYNYMYERRLNQFKMFDFIFG